MIMRKDIKRLVNDHSLACRAHERAVMKREALFDKYTEALAHETNASAEMTDARMALFDEWDRLRKAAGEEL